jgi:hypothetical protein
VVAEKVLAAVGALTIVLKFDPVIDPVKWSGQW